MEEVVNVKVIRPYVLEIDFSDGKHKQVDVQEELEGEIFELLEDPDYFALAVVDGGTVAWPNGADFAPEFLYHQARTVKPA